MNTLYSEREFREALEGVEARSVISNRESHNFLEKTVMREFLEAVLGRLEREELKELPAARNNDYPAEETY